MRVRAIITRGAEIALIERHRHERHYYVLPGGGVEGTETPEVALQREVREELGLLIAVGPLVAEIWRAGDHQHVYHAQVIGGEFGTGDGDEMTGARTADRGTYTPVWMPLTHLSRLRFYPAALVPVITAALATDRPTESVTIINETP